MPSIIYYDSNGAIHAVVTATTRETATELIAANPGGTGLTAMEVPDVSAALYSARAWKVSSGSLAQKTKISVALSGMTVTTTPAVTCTVKVGPYAVSVTNGVGTVSVAAWPTAVPGYASVLVDPADPNYYSDPFWSN